MVNQDGHVRGLVDGEPRVDCEIDATRGAVTVRVGYPPDACRAWGVPEQHRLAAGFVDEAEEAAHRPTPLLSLRAAA